MYLIINGLLGLSGVFFNDNYPFHSLYECFVLPQNRQEISLGRFWVLKPENFNKSIKTSVIDNNTQIYE